MAKIPVMELFGPTIQGEGMVIGRKTMFVRTAGCDYQCSWCDSAFTWNSTEKDQMRWLTVEEIASELKTLGGNRFNHVTITGGNPALIGEAMQAFVAQCHASGWMVGLETQGSRWQDWFLAIDDLTLSPKPPSSGMQTNWERLDDIVAQLTEHQVNFSLKVVVFNDVDFAYARDVFTRYPSTRRFVQVGNDEFNTRQGIAGHLLNRLQWLFDQVIADPAMNDVRVLPQLHALVWGNERAR